MFEFRHQPLKTVYFLYSVVSILFIRLPYWVLSSLVPSWRPRTSWTLSRTVSVYGMQSVVDIIFATGLFVGDDAEKSAKSADKLGFVWIDPLPTTLLTGEIASAARTNNVVSTRTHGYWYGKNVGSGAHGQKASPDERVLYFLHGGGYIMGTACPAGPSGPVIADLVKHCSAILDRAFCLDYRLSSSAPLKVANPFPAAIIDAVAGYRYLVENLGFQARNIIVCGDSAGGHLAFSLVRYLTTESLPSLPPPGAAVLLSPTVDWACTHDQSPTSSMTVNARSDFVKTILHSGFTARSLLGSLPREEIETNAWLSPSSLRIDTHGLFPHFPPTCIVVGGAEQTLDPMKTLRDRLAVDSDASHVTYWEYPDAAHDFLMTSFQEPEKTEASKALVQWIGGIYGTVS
ncbi:alpha/beta-hydrolase [Phlebopus sp. FC_14]|nr:alpha/beta-hydrolase [Phlebopus sp. FC_14]